MLHVEDTVDTLQWIPASPCSHLLLNNEEPTDAELLQIRAPFSLADEIAVLVRNTLDIDDDENSNLADSSITPLAGRTCWTSSRRVATSMLRAFCPLTACKYSMVSNVTARLEALYDPASNANTKTMDRLRVEPRPFVDADAYDYWGSAGGLDEYESANKHRPQTPSTSSESNSPPPSPSASASSTFSLRPLASAQAFSSESGSGSEPAVGNAKWEDYDNDDEEANQEDLVDLEEDAEEVQHDPHACAQSDSDSSYQDG